MVVGFFATQPALFNRGVTNDDNRNRLLAYMTTYGHNQFEDDVFANAFKTNGPIGNRILYGGLSIFTKDIILASKIVQIGLLLTYIFLGFRLGKFVLGNFGGALSVFSILTSEWLIGRIAGGLPRSFFPILTLALIYFLLTKKRYGLLLVMLVGALFYPVVTVVAGVTTVLIEAVTINDKGWEGYWFEHKRWIKAFGMTIVTIVLMLFLLMGSMEAEIGRPYNVAEAVKELAFKEGGRLGQQLPLKYILRELPWALQGRPIYHWERYKKEGIEFAKANNKKKAEWKGRFGELYVSVGLKYLAFRNGLLKMQEWNYLRGDPIGVLIYMLLPIALIYIKWFRFPREIYIFIISAFICYVVSSIVAFRMYAPSRYLIVGMSVLVTQFHVIGFGYAINESNSVRRKLGLSALLLAIFIVRMIFHGPGIHINNGLNVGVTTEQKGLYAYIVDNVGEQKLLAGRPKVMDSIPLFTKRRVLINYESSLVWWKGFNENIVKPRTKVICTAYYAADVGPVVQLRNKYGVDYIMVYKEDLVRDDYPNSYMFSPYNDLGRKLFYQNKGSFYLLHPQTNSIAYQDERYLLVDLSKL